MQQVNSGLCRWGSPLLVMTGSGHLISGSGHLDGDISSRRLTVCRRRSGTGLPVPVSRSDGSGLAIFGPRSAGQNSDGGIVAFVSPFRS